MSSLFVTMCFIANYNEPINYISLVSVVITKTMLLYLQEYMAKKAVLDILESLIHRWLASYFTTSSHCVTTWEISMYCNAYPMYFW